MCTGTQLIVIYYYIHNHTSRFETVIERQDPLGVGL